MFNTMVVGLLASWLPCNQTNVAVSLWATIITTASSVACGIATFITSATRRYEDTSASPSHGIKKLPHPPTHVFALRIATVQSLVSPYVNRAEYDLTDGQQTPERNKGEQEYD